MIEHDFGWALKQVKLGYKITREGWNGPKQYVRLQTPDENSANTLPYLWIRTVQEDRVPWLASQTDILSDDWYITT